MATAVSVVKELLETTKEASDMFTPLKTALKLVLKVWNVYDVRTCDGWFLFRGVDGDVGSQRAVEVQADFIELASKLAALNTVVKTYKKPSDTNMQERLEAIEMYVVARDYLHRPELDVSIALSINSRMPCRQKRTGEYSVGHLSRWEMSRSLRLCSVA